ncbi:MAG: hypothetical protein AAGG00_05455 [Cyanobacteria bacterium P01_H01_bin.150]
MSKRLEYLKALDYLQKAHKKIHKSLSVFKQSSSDEVVLGQMLEAYGHLAESLKAMGYKPNE